MELALDRVSRRFGGVQALSDVSLGVGRGEVVCLVGPSGCGKSTLLRLIAGVDRPDAGTISLLGRDITRVPPEDRHVGFMFQDYALFPHLSARDNILFGLRRRANADAMAEEIIRRLGIGHLVGRFPHMLSGGEQQRVALARALAPRPHVLLMDEPFSNLDRTLRDGIREETLAILAALEATVVMVTHDPEEALSSGDRVVLMRAGRVVQAGRGEDVYDRPESAYAAGFFCDFNRFDGVVERGAVATPFGPITAGFADGTAVQVLLRPQALHPADTGTAATVASVTLMGEIEQTRLRLACGPEVRLRSSRRHGLRQGEGVFLRADPAGVLIFPADAA
ncbi:ABC transporter ATP-binding protein [Cereibacter sp. SYSU M97828]|nr:ABC transporter ATP-binding protein [Cereibacter flavus]